MGLDQSHRSSPEGRTRCLPDCEFRVAAPHSPYGKLSERIGSPQPSSCRITSPMSTGGFTGRREGRELQKFRVLVSNEQKPPHAEYAWTENISSNGARVLTDRPWEAGSVVLLNSSVGQLLTRARVVYCQSLPSAFAVGLEFYVRTIAWFQ